jgi:hypothetical protein
VTTEPPDGVTLRYRPHVEPHSGMAQEDRSMFLVQNYVLYGRMDARLPEFGLGRHARVAGRRVLPVIVPYLENRAEGDVDRAAAEMPIASILAARVMSETVACPVWRSP